MTGIDLVGLIKSLGYLGIFSTILLENGIPLLFFLPGDTLLLTAGLLASQGYLEIEILVIGGFITAVLGYMLGYYIGQRMGKQIFYRKEGSRYIKPEHLEKTKEFYNKYGSLSILIARFLPLRACVCFIAGAVEMPYRTFMLYNVIGAVIWGVMLPVAGYYLGRLVPVNDLAHLVMIPVAGVVFMLIFVPVAMHLIKEKKKNKQDGTE